MAKIVANAENTEQLKVNEETPNQATMFEILQKMKAMEDEIKTLKSKDASVGDGIAASKEKYKWPLKMSYRTRAWVPILSVTTVKKDEEYDLVYKNLEGKYVDNHYVIIQTADGKESKKVPNNTYGISFEKSEPVEFAVITKDGDTISKVTSVNLPTLDIAKIVFDTPTYGKIEVNPNCVN